jgi:hypothetical protein
MQEAIRQLQVIGDLQRVLLPGHDARGTPRLSAQREDKGVGRSGAFLPN